MCTSWVNIYDRKQVPIACVCVLTAQSCPTLWDPVAVARQAPLSMEIFRQGYWSGLPFPSPGDLPNPGIELGTPSLQADSLLPEPPLEAQSESENHSVVSSFFLHHGLQLARLLCPWNSAGKNTVVGSLTILQGIFQTQWLNQGLLHCR